MSRLTKKQRDELPESDFADPARRLWPLLDQEDVDAAVRQIDREKDHLALRRRLRAICKRKQLKPPAAWEEEAKMSAVAEFATTVERMPDTEDPDFVLRHADVIFRADLYDFPEDAGGPFHMAPEEILSYCADFQAPIPLVDTHVDSEFNRKLAGAGLVALTPTADYSAFGGKLRVPKWLDSLFKDEPLRLSATWDRATKSLRNVAMVPNPRITDSAMLAAYAAFAAQKMSPHGQATLQDIHDRTARAGASCREEDRDSANFTAPHEASAIQQIHNLTAKHGAKCGLYESIAGGAHEKPLNTYEAPMSQLDKPAPTAREVELEKQLADVTRKHKEALFAAHRAEAAAFAAEMVTASRIHPSEKPDLVAEFLQAAKDDVEHGGTAQFADERNQQRQGSRVEALKARVRKRPKQVLTRELVPGEAVALFADVPPDDPDKPRTKVNQEVVDSALESTPLGRTIVAERRARKKE